jgi:hypothetical protein
MQKKIQKMVLEHLINNQLRRKSLVQATSSRNEAAELTLKSSKN